MFGAVYLAMMLFRVLVVIIAVMAIIISVSKNKLRTIFGIDIAILIFTVLFFPFLFPTVFLQPWPPSLKYSFEFKKRIFSEYRV